MPASKPFKTHEQQIELLTNRGMLFGSESQAFHSLEHLNYYRLAAYWRPFESDHTTHRFTDGTTFESVLDHYLFDRHFRLILIEAIEAIEVSFRTQWAYHVSHDYGPQGYVDQSSTMIKDYGNGKSDMGMLQSHLNRSDETFIQHHRAHYSGEYPPVWVACEVMSLGLLSRFYSNLKPIKVRSSISKTYQLDETFLEGFMEHLTYVRNVCAHHSRLWNRNLAKLMPLPKNKPLGLRDNINLATTSKIYNTLVIVQHLLNIIHPATDWHIRLTNLIDQHQIDVTAMGFPEDWKSLPIWFQSNTK